MLNLYEPKLSYIYINIFFSFFCIKEYSIFCQIRFYINTIINKIKYKFVHVDLRRFEKTDETASLSCYIEIVFCTINDFLIFSWLLNKHIVLLFYSYQKV